MTYGFLYCVSTDPTREELVQIIYVNGYLSEEINLVSIRYIQSCADLMAQTLLLALRFGSQQWQCNCLHISNFNDLRKIALISVLRLIFLWMQLYVHPQGALCGSGGFSM